jgi:hypothetical protein
LGLAVVMELLARPREEEPARGMEEFQNGLWAARKLK